MSEPNANNPLHWLPKPGQYMPVPGGYVFCRQWEVNHCRSDEFTGTIVFEFRCSDNPLQRPLQNREALPAVPLRLQDQKGDHHG